MCQAKVSIVWHKPVLNLELFLEFTKIDFERLISGTEGTFPYVPDMCYSL